MNRLLTLTLSILTLAALVLLTFSQTTAAFAQCTVKNYLTPYTVVRGDTLYGIARRHNVPLASLVDANCLSNTNRINAGQVLYIPGSQWPYPDTNTEYKMSATYQYFERGYMIWRSDNGAILVHLYTGENTLYPSTRFGALPDNPLRTPSDIYGPIMGFGKLWGNFVDVRDRLGRAVASEASFTLVIIAQTDYDHYIAQDFTGLLVKREGSAIIPTAPAPTPVTTPLEVNVTFQQFDTGFMVWLSHNNRIWVFRGATSGTFQEFLPNTYGNLPDNPQTTQPPAGKVKPVFGFGKLWGNLQILREDLGWATASESAYRLSYLQQPLGFSATLPDGRTLLVEGNQWKIISTATSA
jgi:LysM repeat protein